MKVVLAVCGTSQYRGLPKYFYFLAKHLAMRKTGIFVELIVDSEVGVNRMYEVAGCMEDMPHPKVIGPACQEDRWNAPKTALWAWRVAQYLKNKEFDVFHCGHITPYFYLKHANRRPVVFQPFGNESAAFGEVYSGLSKWYYKLSQGVLRSCGQEANVLLAEADWQLEEMEKFYERKDAKILPVGIDIDFVNEKAEKACIGGRKDFGIQKEDFVTITVNTFHEHKDYPNLIRALAHLPKNFKSILIGSGPESNSCDKLIEELDLGERIYWRHDVPEDELYGYYKLADVYVSPTQCTDFQMGIMEAEVLGLPIVSTAQRYMINGNGYVVPMKHPTTLAEAIMKVYKGDRERMSGRSREIVKRYDFKEIAKKAIEIYGGYWNDKPD